VHDALGGKTPAEVYRDSERRSLAPLVPSYPPEWTTRRASRVGNITMNGDNVFVCSAVARQIIGLQQEGPLRWRAHFFGVDLGVLEIAPLRDALTAERVSSIVSAVSAEQELPPPPSTPPRASSSKARRRPSALKRRAVHPSEVSAMS
jgi:hypothetical protein